MFNPRNQTDRNFLGTRDFLIGTKKLVELMNQTGLKMQDSHLVLLVLVEKGAKP